MTLQTLSVTCRVCRTDRTVTIDDASPGPHPVRHHCRVCNRDRLHVVDCQQRDDALTVGEGSA
ncbi:hypothetical protein [Halorhabdus rudnickae]|uniref:hypothetical protein n=1 Tax=Halorhabdus rudnickae TaxID=1775544 RepID=UPI001083D13C|nr:hypothetical protein [Halorhabdus rudnickae]